MPLQPGFTTKDLGNIGMAEAREYLRNRLDGPLDQSMRGIVIEEGERIYCHKLCHEFAGALVEAWGGRLAYVMFGSSHCAVTWRKEREYFFDARGWRTEQDIRAGFASLGKPCFVTDPGALHALVNESTPDQRQLALRFVELMSREPHRTASPRRHELAALTAFARSVGTLD